MTNQPVGGGPGGRRQLSVVAHLLRWIVLGCASGVLAGVGSYAFLEALDRATSTRLDHPWLLWCLPLAGAAVGLVLHHLGGQANRGTGLLLDEIHQPTSWVPRRMAPMVFVGTTVAHLFGASVGREGAAVQISGSLSDVMARALRLRPEDRRLLLVAAIAGGFGSVFGVPLAGAVFAVEVQAVGRLRHEALVPALTASVVGDLVVRGLGHDHAARAQLSQHLDAGVAARVALAGLAFGLAATAFVASVHVVRRAATRLAPWPPLRLAIGGVATIVLALAVGRDVLGLSLPLLDQSLAGDAPPIPSAGLKLVATALALGCGFPGGEVTPLFVIGATLGATLAGPLGLAPALLAAIGMVAVFGAAAGTPLACTVMGAELFGAPGVALLAIGCITAFTFSGEDGIYGTRRRLVGPPPAPGPT